jgi:hypothetical protein
MQSFDTIQRVRGTRHSGDYEKVIPAGWLPSIPEKMIPLFRVRWDKGSFSTRLLLNLSLSIISTLALLQQYFYAFFLHGMSKSLGLMILLVYLKFCWRILNVSGAVFEAKVAPAKDPHQQNSAGVHQKILSP